MTAPVDPPPSNPATPPDPALNPAVTQEVPLEDESQLPAWAKEKISKINNEARNLRARLHEVEPLAQEAAAAREAQKTEAQRATERASALEAELAKSRLEAERNGLAAQHAIPATHFKFIVGDTPEERAESAKGIAEMLAAAAQPQVTPPPTNRPTQTLRPGASPVPPADNAPPTAFPDWFLPPQPPTKG